MRKYETVVISDPDLSDQSRSDLYDKVRNIITTEKGILLDFDDWGNKKLAYEIRKKLRGHYVCITYGGNGELVKEIERNFRLTDDVLKFMTIVLSEDLSAEDLEKEIETYAQSKETEPAAETSEEKEASEETTEEDIEDDSKEESEDKETEEETKE